MKMGVKYKRHFWQRKEAQPPSLLGEFVGTEEEVKEHLKNLFAPEIRSCVQFEDFENAITVKVTMYALAKRAPQIPWRRPRLSEFAVN